MSNSDWKTASEEAKKNYILDAALRVFGNRGFYEPTMDDVAVEAHYSRRSLYRFFPSKDELGFALTQRCCNALMQFMGPLESKSLVDIVFDYYQYSLEQPQIFRVFLDTRQWLESKQSLLLKTGPDTGDMAFINIVVSQLGVAGAESIAAAIGYIEFLFRNRGIWKDTGLAGDSAAVYAVIKKILE